MNEARSGIDPMALLFGQHAADDPDDSYRTLREQCPVASSDFAGTPSWWVSRYQDVLWAMRHPRVFSSSAEAISLSEDQPLIPLQVDPPLHTAYRRLLNPLFVPRRIAELEPDIRALVNHLIDAFAPRGECDFGQEFSERLPSTIFLRLMGLHLSDLPKFVQWRDDTIRPEVEPGDLGGAERKRAAAARAITEYFEDAIAQRRREPGQGLIADLLEMRVDGRPLDQKELLGMCHLLLLGGLDTVTASLDCLIRYLARAPEHRQQLIDDPASIPAAIEELLRHETPVMVVPRVAHEEVTLSGVTIRPGETVTLVIGAANGDETEFADADQVDLARDPNRHLAFGAGNHLCLGAHLARLELRVALEELHRRIPDYRIRDDMEVHHSPGIRQAAHLPLVFTSEPVGASR